MIKYIEAIYNKDNYIEIIEFIKETFNKFEKIKKENGIYSHEDIMSKAIESLENKKQALAKVENNKVFDKIKGFLSKSILKNINKAQKFQKNTLIPRQKHESQ